MYNLGILMKMKSVSIVHAENRSWHQLLQLVITMTIDHRRGMTEQCIQRGPESEQYYANDLP